MIVSPSLLAADFSNLQKDIDMLNSSNADWLHLDIMDGVFVPNISFGFPVISSVAKICKKPLDVHLMIVKPERYIKQVKRGRRYDDERTLRGMHTPAPHHPRDTRKWYESGCDTEPFDTDMYA